MRMKKLLHSLLLSALFCSFAPGMKAQLTSVDLYGEWKLEGNIEITAAGEPYAESLSSTTVTLSKGSYDIQMLGFCGATKSVFDGRLKDGALFQNTYAAWTVNGATLAVSNSAGVNPWNPSNIQVFEGAPVSADGKTITLPDFTIVKIAGYATPDAEILLRGTNCKLTMVEQEEIVAADLSGEWRFAAAGTVESEGIFTDNFPTEFDMTLTSTSENNKVYDAELRFEGFEPLTIKDAKFNGVSLEIPFNNTYLDAAKQILFYNFSANVAEGTLKFNMASETSLSLMNGLRLVQITEGETVLVQYYSTGNAVRKIEASDFAGSYTVKVGNIEYVDARPYDVQYPNEFQVVIEEDNGQYFITTFLNEDTYLLNYGGIEAFISAADPTTLEIPTGGLYCYVKYLGGERENQVFATLGSPTGEEKGTVTITLTKEGTASMSDFSLFVQGEIDALFTDITISKNADGIKHTEAAPAKSDIYAADGRICIAGEPQYVEVYSLTGARVYNGTTSEVAGLGKGLYIVKTAKNVQKVLLW